EIVRQSPCEFIRRQESTRALRINRGVDIQECRRNSIRKQAAPEEFAMCDTVLIEEGRSISQASISVIVGTSRTLSKKPILEFAS
ncbi:MAG: hypothetical protein AB1813_24390, partial [Verrucomicrobiota bacterium]